MAKRGVFERLRAVFGSLCCESTVVTLTLLSVLSITGEILIDYGILTAPGNSEEGQKRSNSSQQLKDTSSENSQREALESVLTVFHYISLAIAVGFSVEMLLKISAYRRSFFMQPWQVLDLLVVCAALAVEVAFEVNGRLPELEVVTFIIICRLWRIPHACNIRAERVQRDLEQEIEVWKAGASKMQDRCNTLDTRISKQKDKIERLEREIATLKKDVKESNSTTRKPEEPATLPNGTIPAKDKSRASASHLTAPPSSATLTTQATTGGTQYSGGVTPKEQESLKPATHGHIRAASEDTTDGSPGRTRNLREKKRDMEEDTVVEDDEVLSRGRHYFRSGSESSLSCHATEQEVHVQIEENGGGKHTEDLTSSLKMDTTSLGERDGHDDMAVQIRKMRTASSPDDKTKVVAGTDMYHYDNGGYQPDLGDPEDFHGELLQEFDGARTYRSADGIPMTDL